MLKAAPLSLFGLTGRVAVVTGAADGMGRSMALGLAGAGAGIAVADVDEDRLEATVADIAATGSRALGAHCDVGSEADVERLFETVDREFGQVDILVNNAGANMVSAPAEVYPLDGWERMVRVNLTGQFLCARAAGQRMIAQGRGGTIVNISSISGWNAANRQSLAFGAAKAGLNQLTKDLAVEWAHTESGSTPSCPVSSGLEDGGDHRGSQERVACQDSAPRDPDGQDG